jgi:hypothetical protein
LCGSGESYAKLFVIFKTLFMSRVNWRLFIQKQQYVLANDLRIFECLLLVGFMGYLCESRISQDLLDESFKEQISGQNRVESTVLVVLCKLLDNGAEVQIFAY